MNVANFPAGGFAFFMSKKYVHIDLARINDLRDKRETTGIAIAMEARLSESTWARIMKSGRTSFPNCCAIAYVLKVDPYSIILRTEKQK